MCSLDFRGGPPLQLPAGTNLTVACTSHSSSSSRQTVSIHGSQEPPYIPNGALLRIVGCNVLSAPSLPHGNDLTSSEQLGSAFFGGTSQGDVHLDTSTLACPFQARSCHVVFDRSSTKLGARILAFVRSAGMVVGDPGTSAIFRGSQSLVLLCYPVLSVHLNTSTLACPVWTSSYLVLYTSIYPFRLLKRRHKQHNACMQFFQKYAAEPSYVEATIDADSHAYVHSSEAQFLPSAANATSAAVAFTHAQFHPLAVWPEAGVGATGNLSKVATGALPGVQLQLTASSLVFSSSGFDTAGAVVQISQRQLQAGPAIQVLPPLQGAPSVLFCAVLCCAVMCACWACILKSNSH